MKRILLPLLFAPSMAFAHAGQHGESAFLSGLGHPVGGADHVLTMVAIGLWASVIGGCALWLLPMAFVAAMLAGGGLGALALPLPGVEPMILASVVLTGIAAALALRPPLAAAAGFVAFFALFHGHAHGSEGPAIGLSAYALGFGLATTGLHLAGLVLGMGLTRLAQPQLARGFGGAAALAGLALAFA